MLFANRNTVLNRGVLKTMLLLIIACFLSELSYSQKTPPKKSKPIDPLEAKEHFSHNNYLFAVKFYEQLASENPENVDYHYKLALCYLRTNLSKKSAIKPLEYISKNPTADNEVWFDLGRAYQYDNRFDDAIKAYNKYKEKAKGKDLEKAERRIEMCNNGKEFVKFPLKVKFELLGKEINTVYPDYYPFISEDESILAFTTRRDGNVGGSVEADGYYSSDIYISTARNGGWNKAKNIGSPISTKLDEQVVYLDPQGKTMLIYIDHIDSLGNIYITPEGRKPFEKMIRLNDNVNLGFETSGCLSSDGTLLFFASEREGGYGGTDLYMSKKLPNGTWAIPQNLGPRINTKYNEDFPRLLSDGKTLYFASEGHSSMGDFDIFKSIGNPEINNWAPPKNLGYPINDGTDNRTVSPTADGKVMYLSASKEKGVGDLDIYRVAFDDAEQKYTIVIGNLVKEDTLNKRIEATINVVNMQTKEELVYIPTLNTGKYVMALTPGKYSISVEAKGYQTITDNVEVFGMGSFKSEINKDFKLIKEGSGSALPPVKKTTPIKK